MNLTLLVTLGGLLLFVGLFALLYGVLRRGIQVGDRIIDRDKKAPSSDEAKNPWQDRMVNFFKPLGEMLPRSPSDLSAEGQKLAQAGYRRKDAVALFYGVRIATAVVLFLGLTITRAFGGNFILIVILSIFLGALVPDMWLRWKISKRKLAIQHGLPDMMDLSVVCVEAGMGLDQAVKRIGQEIGLNYPDLASELNLYSLEVQAGRSRADALRNLGVRTGVEDLRVLAAVLVQADRFGTSIAQSLRIFSDDLRVKRRQRAEEMAAKMSVKMIPPMLVFIFPAVFVVVAGPAIITIVRDFFRVLGQG